MQTLDVSDYTVAEVCSAMEGRTGLHIESRENRVFVVKDYDRT